MEHGSNLIERIKTDLKDFEFGLIRFYPLNPLFPRSIKVLIGSGSSGLGDIIIYPLAVIGNQIPLYRNELYLLTDEFEILFERAFQNGAKKISGI